VRLVDEDSGGSTAAVPEPHRDVRELLGDDAQRRPVSGLRRPERCRRGVDVLDPALTSGLVDGDGDHAATDRAGVAERENGGSIGLFRCVVPEHDLARMEGFPLVGLAGRVDDDDRAVRPRHDLHGGGAHEQSSEALESPGTEHQHVCTRRCGQQGLDRWIGIPKCSHDEVGPALPNGGSGRFGVSLCRVSPRKYAGSRQPETTEQWEQQLEDEARRVVEELVAEVPDARDAVSP
jgi:hypothetical protein